ncbi:MAG TPA: hypothetical protein VGR11_15565 [Solirubrobacteraceae bacterium]|nr:hypothetical protein [Solirubrobacteraceae bacterium]
MTVDKARKLIPAVVAAAVVAGIAIATTWGDPAVSQQAPATVQKAAFSKDKAERATDLDLGKKGPSAGDRIVTRGPLFDRASTSKRIGSYTAELVNIDPASLLTQMTVTVIFPDGQLTVGGSLPFRRTLTRSGAVLPITGGTGAYKHASGTATVHSRKLRGDEGFLFNFEIATR